MNTPDLTGSYRTIFILETHSFLFETWRFMFFNVKTGALPLKGRPCASYMGKHSSGQVEQLSNWASGQYAWSAVRLPVCDALLGADVLQGLGQQAVYDGTAGSRLRRRPARPTPRLQSHRSPATQHILHVQQEPRFFRKFRRFQSPTNWSRRYVPPRPNYRLPGTGAPQWTPSHALAAGWKWSIHTNAGNICKHILYMEKYHLHSSFVTEKMIMEWNASGYPTRNQFMWGFPQYVEHRR